ncbi:MAG: hypothetical protein Q8R57_02185 [Bacteroidota bacterium]|nr:hypothetical protein [Bacteroidota bacterium]
MKAIKFSAIALVAITMSLSACKKDETTTETPKVAGSTLLVGKDWKTTAFTRTSPGGTIDVFAISPACEKDDLVEYLANGTSTEKAGATKCDPADPDTQPGAFWALLENDTKFRMIYGDTILANVVELTANTFRIRIVEDDNGITNTTNITMVKN